MLPLPKTSASPPLDFQALFEASANLFLVLAPDLTIVAASNAYLYATKTPRENLIGHRLFDVLPDGADDNRSQSLKASLDRVLKNRLPDTMAVQKYTISRPESKDGECEERYWSPVNTPIFDKNGDILYILHRIEDVTDFMRLQVQDMEQVRENATLRCLTEQMETTIYLQAQEVVNANHKIDEARIFLKNIIDHVADPIFVKDRQHRWIEGNAALWALFGKSESELIGKSDYDFFPREEADVFWQKDEEVFNSGKPNINVENFTDASGVTHVISTKKACFLGPNNEQILVGVIRDITDLVTMEARLKESDEARLKSIMDHSGRPVYIKDLEGRYLRVNTDLLKLIGCTEEDMIGKTDYDFFPKEIADTFRRNDLTVIEKGAAIECEEIAPHPDGPHTYTSVKFPIYDANHNLYAVCGISTDMTERKKAEEQLLRYTRELERSNHELDDFAYIASHDLKEPLRGLFNHASFLMEDYGDKLDSAGVQRLKRLSQLCQHMERLVNDLLYFARLGRSHLAVQETDPNAIVGDIRQLLESFIKEHNARIAIPSLLPNIICDRPRITEVFRNLITNAIKYNDKPQPEVEIGFLECVDTPAGPEKNVFYVRDNGVGIDPEFHEEIFRIFKRLNNGPKQGQDGTGVGLTFVKKIIERHNGRIWLESTPGNGATFYFTLGRMETV